MYINSSDYSPMFLNNNIQSKSQMINNQLNKPLFSFDFDADKKSKKNNNKIISRKGDWVCCKCANLNFAFRSYCNRCHLTKSENQRLLYNENFVKGLIT